MVEPPTYGQIPHDMIFAVFVFFLFVVVVVVIVGFLLFFIIFQINISAILISSVALNAIKFMPIFR